MGTLQSALPMETPLEMEITLRLLGEKEPVRVSLRVGQERMYVVKSMAQFLRGLQEKTAIAFGKGFVLEPEWMGFTGVDAKIIKLLQDAAYVCQLEGKLVQTGLDAKYLTVADRFVPRLMQLLMAKPFKISFGEEVVSVPSVFDGQVELLFGVFASGRELEVRAQMPKTLRMLDADCAYVYCEGDVLRLPEAQRGIVRVLLAAQGRRGLPAAFRFGRAAEHARDLRPAACAGTRGHGDARRRAGRAHHPSRTEGARVFRPGQQSGALPHCVSLRRRRNRSVCRADRADGGRRAHHAAARRGGRAPCARPAGDLRFPHAERARRARAVRSRFIVS